MLQLFTKTYRYLLLNRYIQLSLLYLILFGIPILLPLPQIFQGIIINFLILTSVYRFRMKDIFVAMFLPSLAVYISGELMGSGTDSMLYLIPLIGFSNVIFAYIFQKGNFQYHGVLLGSFVKWILLLLGIYILYELGIVPLILLSTVGILQITTAIVGGSFAYILKYIYKK